MGTEQLGLENSKVEDYIDEVIWQTSMNQAMKM